MAWVRLSVAVVAPLGTWVLKRVFALRMGILFITSAFVLPLGNIIYHECICTTPGHTIAHLYFDQFRFPFALLLR